MELEYRIDEIGRAAKQVISVAGASNVWAFDGGMGAGKTTMIHALCDALEVRGNFGSPTFSIINEYEGPSGPVYHIDLYRCKDEEEAVRAGVEECLYSGHRCMVEWPSRAEGIFPADTLRISIDVLDTVTRKVRVVG